MERDEGPPPPGLLDLYRRDRRKLLRFVLNSSSSSSSAAAGRDVSSLPDDALDSVSVDYVIRCIVSGEHINIDEAIDKYYEEAKFPIMVTSQSMDAYLLLTNPDSSGSPPSRIPPEIDRNQSSKFASTSNYREDPSAFETTIYYSDRDQETFIVPSRPEVIEVPPLGLPRLITGLLDDDLQKTAYEILLASIHFSGNDLHIAHDKKKEKNSKLFSGMKRQKSKSHVHSYPQERHIELVEIMRTQMQISEAMDVSIRQKLCGLAGAGSSKRIDIPHISLGLLNGMHERDFSNEKDYKQWRTRQVHVLEELVNSCGNLLEYEDLTAGEFLEKMRDPKVWEHELSSSERLEVSSRVNRLISRLSSMPGVYGLEGETCYWTAAYHLNVRLYEKILFGLFDILDENQLLEETDEVIALIRTTWPILGITEEMHEALFSWVLFQQFTSTNEPLLLDQAILKLQKLVDYEVTNLKEKQFLENIACSWQCNDIDAILSLVQAITYSISFWCHGRLQDYHVQFSKEPSTFGGILKLLSLVGVAYTFNGEMKLLKLSTLGGDSHQQLKCYVQKSLEAAYKRVASTIELESKVARTHPLALLADEVKKLAKREYEMFYPVLSQWYPEAGVVSMSQLKKYYGERLQPYLVDASHLSQDVKVVLSAADDLDRYLSQLYASSCMENKLDDCLVQDQQHYQIEQFAAPIILDWVIAQHTRIMQWTARTIDLEEWEALSLQQKQAPSVVEVFRIIEQTVDQFFEWNLPMNITHLQALLSVIFHSLDAFLLKISDGIVERKHLLPTTPPLTRYTDAVMPIIKRKILEVVETDEKVKFKLAQSTISKLCIRLNTLQYLKKQVDILEDNLRKSWARVKPSCDERSSMGDMENSDCLTYSEAVDELFSTSFRSIRDTASNAIGRISDLVGLRMIFWDLRDSFLSRLYCPTVEAVRLDSFLPQFDTELNRICGLLDDSIRDLVVLSICRASMEAYVWVLLEGGPSRAFSDSDVSLMEEDFSLLKEFFIAEGEGLPRTTVEQEAANAGQILQLFSYEASTVIKMLLKASGRMSAGLHSRQHGNIPEDAYVLVRVLCHKKDREASKFLKQHYDLPMSSEYDDLTPKESSGASGLISDIIERSSSFRLTEKSQKSLSSFKKRIQEATSGLGHAAW
ncbi:hypothetical protein MLD38_018445 [Melastoma candidum]|uniref:Uncharacterized protein n=1 Tax=Melastoma candidum TaxID=119954 RepID=A0ACB9QTV3_9MYRT|nr:hypothetical protein MLD38_018445 [Melastoma candidum]